MSADLLSRSAAVFGNRYFAPVVGAIARLDARGELLTARAIARECEIVDSLVRPVLTRLVTAEILRVVPRTGGARSAQYYTLTENPITKGIIYIATTLQLEASASAD